MQEKNETFSQKSSVDDVSILKKFVERYGTVVAAAEELGLSRHSLDHYLKGRKPVGAKLRERLRMHGYYSDEVRGWDAVKDKPPMQRITMPNGITRIPMMLTPVHAGNPALLGSETGAYLEPVKYFNDDTYMVQVIGDSMRYGGVEEGDWLLVDSKRMPIHNSIVVARVGDGCVVKRLKVNGGSYLLHPENKDYPEIQLEGRDDVEIIGVVLMVVTVMA